MNVFRLLPIFLILCFAASGQEQPGTIDRADELFDRSRYAEAASLYLRLAEKKQPDGKTIQKLATCYFRMNEYASALRWYENLKTLPEELPWNDYACSLLATGDFSNARVAFRTYFGKNQALLTRALARVDSAQAWMSDPRPGQVVRLEARWNSPFSDWGLTRVGGSLLFLSDRDTAMRYGWTGNGFYRIRQERSGTTMLSELNRLFPGNHHIGPVTFSGKGDTAYVTVTTAVAKRKLLTEKGTLSGERIYTRRMELFIVRRVGQRWSSPVRFPYSDANAWSLGQAALSPDGSLLYFVSDRPGGSGGLDLWFCKKQNNGWGRPVNCGTALNTRDDEAFPTMAGSTLYFSSKGLAGMGGYDLFEASGQGASWKTPRNLKYPINSTSDDFWLMAENADSGYFSSNRPGGTGSDDIYAYKKANYPKAVESPVPQPSPPGIPNTLPVAANLAPGDKFVLRNIYYDLDKWTIRPDAALELDRLTDLLKQRPELRIELSSHTDARANDGYNLTLSQRRAEAAVAYLVERGIAASRLVARGYGETQLVNSCANGVYCTEADHQLNRRTEIRVLGNDH